jgi:hypothetical protein
MAVSSERYAKDHDSAPEKKLQTLDGTPGHAYI